MNVSELKGYMRSTVKPKQQNLNYYLEMLRLLDYDVTTIEIWSTAGSYRPPYPFQFRAIAKLQEGDDGPLDGIGGSPLEAVRDLYKQVKKAGLTLDELRKL